MPMRHVKRATHTVLGHAARAYNRVRRNQSAAARRALGIGFVIGGFLAVLPVFGIWMLPVGLALLSDDVPALRRLRRRAHAKLLAWAQDRTNRPRLLRRQRPDQPRSARGKDRDPGARSAPVCPGRAD